ncbi:MAG TPA: hypothetical protein VLB50_12925, partial [Ignavibacteriaceae bacterium]|nr:hypothetical protein [Ignavibacteriaceae bacterium]
MCQKNRWLKLLLPAFISSILIICISECLIAQDKNVEPKDTSKVIQEIKDFSEKDNFFSRILKIILAN